MHLVQRKEEDKSTPGVMVYWNLLVVQLRWTLNGGCVGLAALISAIIGAIIIWGIKGSEKLSFAPSLDVRACGWIFFLTGIGFAVVYATPHYHRWRGTFRE